QAAQPAQDMEFQVFRSGGLEMYPPKLGCTRPIGRGRCRTIWAGNPPKVAQPAQRKILKDNHLGGLGDLGVFFGQVAKISCEPSNPSGTQPARAVQGSPAIVLRPPPPTTNGLVGRRRIKSPRECVSFWQGRRR